MTEGNDGDLLRIRGGEIAHEALYLVERVVSCVESGVGRRRDVPMCGRCGGDGRTWSMRARGRSVVLIHAVVGARGEMEGQEPKLGFCDSTTREVDVDVRMAHLP